MGSLMAGWSTSPPCPKIALERKTSSLTRDEVKRYWLAKAKKTREHLMEAQRAAYDAGIRSKELDLQFPEDDEDYFPFDSPSEGESPSGSQPATPTLTEGRNETFKDGWWRRSNYAFLNEPPTQESKHSNYVAQFHVPLVDVRAKAAEIEHPNAKRTIHHTMSSLSIF